MNSNKYKILRLTHGYKANKVGKKIIIGKKGR